MGLKKKKTEDSIIESELYSDSEEDKVDDAKSTNKGGFSELRNKRNESVGGNRQGDVSPFSSIGKIHKSKDY